MIRQSRNLILDVFDYNDNKLCNLYDNRSRSVGLAANVYITTERNGWKELSFDLPSSYQTLTGTEENYRLQFLKADYRIRSIDDYGTDWFIISEPKVTHKSFSKNVNIIAGHCSQMLKIKNLNLVFSDDEGNNVGTATKLLDTILKGTGWSVGNVYKFLEKDGKTLKVRSLVASAKTGAFKLITKMCELFEAKPVFHGGDKTVDILPINPFSKPDDDTLPDVTEADGVLLLHYSQNVNNIVRKMNTDNVVTKLYAYGAYGDTTHGYCGIEECKHTEHIFTLLEPLYADQYYYFEVLDDAEVKTSRSFKTDVLISAGSKVIWSTLDPTSMMYVWIQDPVFKNSADEVWSDLDSKLINLLKQSLTASGKAFATLNRALGSLLKASYEKKLEQNWFQFVTDFTYFNEVNLLTDDALQKVASYQRSAAETNRLAYEKARDMADAITLLSSAIGSVNFCKLDVASISEVSGGCTRLKLNKTELHPDGIIYRSDYDVNRKKHFQWTRTELLKTNGDPVTTGASMVFVIYAKDNESDPIQWAKSYVKQFDDTDDQWPENDPDTITLHAIYRALPRKIDVNRDQIFLFGSNNINGWLGAYEAADEAAVQALQNKTKVVTVPHPVYFGTEFPPIDRDAEYPGIIENDPVYFKIENYSWFWKYYYDETPSELYFCYIELRDTKWNRVHISDEAPTKNIGEGEYWFNWAKSTLHRRIRGLWAALSTEPERKVAQNFGYIIKMCTSRDEYRNGVYLFYNYTVGSGGLPAGNYYIKSDYDTFWVLTTKQDLGKGDVLSYSTEDGWIKQTRQGVVSSIEVKNYRFDSVDYHPSNVYDGIMLGGMIDTLLGLYPGSERNVDGYCRSSKHLRVYPNNEYLMVNKPASCIVTIHEYDYNKHWLRQSAIDMNGSFKTGAGTYYIKLSVNVLKEQFLEAYNFRIVNFVYGKSIIINEKNYILLDNIERKGLRRGIMAMIEKLAFYADDAYLNKTQSLSDAQLMIERVNESMQNALGDAYREGYWQKSDYVDGDEDKLYEDAVDNIKRVARPLTTYTLTYVDRYGSDEDPLLGISDDASKVKWPDISIKSAIHLIDEDIDVNCWAYVDKIQKCYDQPWQTKININTNMTTIAQHSFADVLSNIADVANAMKGKESIISRALTIGKGGALAVDNLVGSIDASKVAIFGGASTWHTDERGNMVFLSADGRAAMTLTGNGFSISNGKNEYGDWVWRTFGTGEGFTADEIVTGYLSSSVIEADSIAMGKLSSEVQLAIDSAQRIGSSILSGDIDIAYYLNNSDVAEVRLGKLVGLRIVDELGNFFQVNDRVMGFFERGEDDKFRSLLWYADGAMHLTGLINASGGHLGSSPLTGWIIGDNALYNRISTFGSILPGVYIGTDGINLGGAFTVDSDGNLIANKASITGSIYATSLKILSEKEDGIIIEQDADEHFYSTHTGIEINEDGIVMDTDKSITMIGGKILLATPKILKPLPTPPPEQDPDVPVAGGTNASNNSLLENIYSSYISFDNEAIQIATDPNAESFINFGDGKFIISSDGLLTAKTGLFEQLRVGIYDVLTKKDMPREIYLGTVLPEKYKTMRDFIWIKPSAEIIDVPESLHFCYFKKFSESVGPNSYGPTKDTMQIEDVDSFDQEINYDEVDVEYHIDLKMICLNTDVDEWVEQQAGIVTITFDLSHLDDSNNNVNGPAYLLQYVAPGISRSARATQIRIKLTPDGITGPSYVADVYHPAGAYPIFRQKSGEGYDQNLRNMFNAMARMDNYLMSNRMSTIDISLRVENYKNGVGFAGQSRLTLSKLLSLKAIDDENKISEYKCDVYYRQ